MRILCVIDSLISGGAQKQMVELAIGFKEKGHDVCFLTYHDIDFFKPRLDKAGIEVKKILEPNYIKRLLKMRKAIRNHKPNGVIAFLDGSCFISTFAGLPSKNWTLIVGERNAKPELLKSFKSRIYRFFHFFADYVVANSQANLDLVLKANPFLNKKKLKVIYNIVNIPSNIKDVREDYQKVSEIVKVVIAARYDYQKNLEALIEAVNELPSEYKCKLQIDWYGRKSKDNKRIIDNQNKINNYNLQSIIRLNDV